MLHVMKSFVTALILFWILSCASIPKNGVDAAAGPVVQWKHDWSRGAVFYEIFVRSFSDSNGDGIGDINGLISKLDYLNDGNPATTHDLEIDAIWLMPVFESPSYHGYDVVDYRKIDKEYGTDADFTRFLNEAHGRGIRVIVDYVMNHSSSEHPWFQESSSSLTAKKRNWYVWNPINPGWTQPWSSNPTWHFKNGAYYYGLFWSGMPDLNFRNPEVRKEFRQTASYWLKKGLDGFRLDATRYLIETGGGPGQADNAETHAVLRNFSAHVRRIKPQATLVGENWTDTGIIADYYGSTATIHWGDELPMNFNFPLAANIIEGIKTQDAGRIASVVAEMQQAYPSNINDAPFLTNHDMIRLSTQLNRNSADLRTAASLLLTLPGAPFLYYGEEVGLQNAPGNQDEAKRTPMPWDNTTRGGFTSGNSWYQFAPGKQTDNVATQTQNQNSLLTHYRNLIRARKGSQALRHGGVELLTSAGSQDQAFAFIRSAASERVLVAHNLSDSLRVAGPYSFSAASFERIYSDGNAQTPSGASGRWNITLPPGSTGIWRIR